MTTKKTANSSEKQDSLYPNKQVRVNVGCGKKVLDGWINVDVQANPKAPRAPDHLCDAREIPLKSGSADLVMALHLIEHFFRWEAESVLAEWHRLLKPGGILILELPNLEAACRNLLAGMNDQMSMWPIYGDWNHNDPYMMHKHGYTPKTIRDLLEKCRFSSVKILPPEHHGRRANRDMRVEAKKK